MLATAAAAAALAALAAAAAPLAAVLAAAAKVRMDRPRPRPQRGADVGEGGLALEDGGIDPLRARRLQPCRPLLPLLRLL